MYDFLQSFVAGVKPVFILFDIIFFFGFLYALINGWKYRPHIGLGHAEHPAPTLSRQVAKEQWQEIRKKFNSGIPDLMKSAIMEADKFVDTILKTAGYKGEHMADRLEKILRDDIKTIDKLWEAHRYRNEVVHSPDFDFIESDAERTMQDYEAFLREIQILEPAAL
jgi:hypothetical protein